MDRNQVDKNIFRIRIAGKDYTISGHESEEYMYGLARYVENKFQEASKTGGGVNSFDSIVLTAINIADDYFQVKMSAPDVRGRVGELEDSVVQLEKELNESRQVIKMLEEKLRDRR